MGGEQGQCQTRGAFLLGKYGKGTGNTPRRDRWRLWIVPAKGMEDKREFYRRVSEGIKGCPIPIDLDVGQVELTPASHRRKAAAVYFGNHTSVSLASSAIGMPVASSSSSAGN